MDRLSPSQNLSHWAVEIHGDFMRTPPGIHIPMENRAGTVESYPVCISVIHPKRSMGMGKSRQAIGFGFTSSPGCGQTSVIFRICDALNESKKS